jgi:hypothetical protein
MYGSEETKAFCCNCKELTLHKYTNFSCIKTAKPRTGGFLPSFLELLGQQLGTNAPSGDYKCTQCGTYLHSDGSYN